MIISPAVTLSNISATFSSEPSTCNDLHGCRTLWNIVWSSLFTVFACIWLSIHPNIPAPGDSWGRKGVRRVWTMILALLAPELIVGWASWQLIVASRIAEENREHGWTKTHGFFALMGGFMQHHNNGPPTVLEAKDVPDMIKKRTLEAEIQDKSKGDALSKTFALVQTTWFILQCISRAIEGIAVVKLEIATCAFAVLNFATYVLWWNKPLNVRRPILVYQDQKKLEDRATDGGQDRGNVEINERTERGEIETGEEAAKCGCGEAFIQGLMDIPKEVYRVINGAVEASDAPRQLPLNFISPILGGTSFESNQRVGTFGPEIRTHSDEITTGLTSAAVGIVFGSIHCAAWQFQFPSYIEQLLWRISAISVTGGPILIGLFRTLANKTSVWKEIVGRMGFVLLLILYIFARLALLVLSFITLRSLPPGAFRAADWTRFIPHFA